MDGILNSGIPVILWFQSLGDWLLGPMEFFSFLGTEDFYLLILPIIYWGFDARLGLRLGVMIALTSGINIIFKFAFRLPRPYWVNTEVKALATGVEFGVPSGHAQNALALWGLVGTYIRKFWVWVLVIFVILGISLSRLYLALHFPIDTVAGWVIGFLLLYLFNRAWDPVSTWAEKQSMGKQIGTAFGVSMVLLFLAVGVKAFVGDWIMPVAWEQNAARAVAELGGEMPDPFSLSVPITSSAILFGFLTGLAWLAPQGGYRVASKVKTRILQYLVGVVGVGIFYAGLKLVFPDGDDLIAYFFRFVRYTLVGFWVTGLAPFTFIKLNLTD